jgi:serine/threonine-protein kinase
VTAAADRHLLFGLIALQNGLIDQGQLMLAFQAWTRDKGRPLAEHLVARGDLDAEQRAGVEAMVALHVKKHGDVEKSLAAVPANRSTGAGLAGLGEPEIEATLARVARATNRHPIEPDEDNDPARTAGLSLGAATSDGQRFRILRPHSRGGLGEVFVALDSELHREVALKQILEKHADDPVSRQRFVAEAEITGGLEHPGIVPVYGLGTYPDGRPYYAMRFIRGDSLKESIAAFHADNVLRADPGRRALGLLKLLRRFLAVCDAIDYAHSRGVLHRDLKPSNVVLGQHGETLVVDWGLAKALGRTESAVASDERLLVPSLSSGSPETLPGSALGTPRYMSPEQAGGHLDRLGPRSDFGLGATLYSLLTGQAPVEDDDVGAVLRAVQKGDFPQPRQLDPAIDPALEAVCLKALALQPEDRYATPRALAEDIEHWMADEPVAAWPEPLARRARRWARRNRTAVAAAAVALLVALGGMATVLAVQARANWELKLSYDALADANARVQQANGNLQTANDRERASRELAQRRFDLARQAIEQYYTGASEDVLLKQPELKALRTKLMNTSLCFYKKLQAELERSDDRSTRGDLAAAYARVGEILGQVGSEADASEAFGRAIAIRDALVQEDPADIGARRALADLLEKLCLLDLRLSGHQTKGMRAVERALVLREAISAESPGAADDLRAIAANLRATSRAHGMMGQFVEAQRAVERARVIAERIVSDHPDVASFRYELATACSEQAWLEHNAGQEVKATRSQGEAVRLMQRLVADHPENIDYHNELAIDLTLAGNLCNSAGRPSEALPYFKRSLEIYQRLALDYPTVANYQHRIARSHMFIARDFAELGRPREALDSLDRAVPLFERLGADHPGDVHYKEDSAFTQMQIANAHRVLGRPSEVRRALGRASEIYEQLSTAMALYNLGCAESRLCDPALSDPAASSTIVSADRQAHVDRAIVALRRAAAAGMRNGALWRRDPDLDPLRSRPDFQLLMMDLEFPDDPFAHED